MGHWSAPPPGDPWEHHQSYGWRYRAEWVWCPVNSKWNKEGAWVWQNWTESAITWARDGRQMQQDIKGLGKKITWLEEENMKLRAQLKNYERGNKMK